MISRSNSRRGKENEYEKEMHPASDEPPSPPFPGSDVTTKKRGLYKLPV